MIKDFFDLSFASEDAESEVSKEKANKWKKKSKTDKKSTKDVNFFVEQE